MGARPTLTNLTNPTMTGQATLQAHQTPTAVAKIVGGISADHSSGPSGSCRSSGRNSLESSGSHDVYAETRLSLICNEAPAHACSNADCDNIRWFDTRDDSWSRYCSNKCRIDAAAPTCSIANCPYACWLDEDGSWSQWCGNKCRRAAQEALYELKDITSNEQLGATSSYAMDAEDSGDGRMWLFQRPGHQVL